MVQPWEGTWHTHLRWSISIAADPPSCGIQSYNSFSKQGIWVGREDPWHLPKMLSGIAIIQASSTSSLFQSWLQCLKQRHEYGGRRGQEQPFIAISAILCRLWQSCVTTTMINFKKTKDPVSHFSYPASHLREYLNQLFPPFPVEILCNGLPLLSPRDMTVVLPSSLRLDLMI